VEEGWRPCLTVLFIIGLSGDHEPLTKTWAVAVVPLAGLASCTLPDRLFFHTVF
jgi:hypothetical protein